jgi:hypothetical protein
VLEIEQRAIVVPRQLDLQLRDLADLRHDLFLE